jgi:probable rRNA maturation factor
MSARRNNAVVVDVLVQSPQWKKKPRAKAEIRAAIRAAADATSAPNGEVAVVLTSDAALRKLNRQWRGIDKATNVLSFPAAAPKMGILGDIAIAYETLVRESRHEHKEFAQHLSHLAIHGFLHLMGYDHQNDSDAEAMEKVERTVLARLGIPDPYLARGPGRNT